MAGSSINKSQAEIAREKRREERNLDIPPLPPEKIAYRDKLEADPIAWIDFFLADEFQNPRTPDQLAQIQAILNAVDTAADQAIAAERGGGKTTNVMGGVIYLVTVGKVDFVVIIGATAATGSQVLANVKAQYEENDRLLEYYPEVCVAIRDAAPSPQKTNNQIVNDVSVPRWTWSSDKVEFPKIPGTKCGGSLIMARGLDGAIRGLNVKGRRPSLVIFDDIETEASVESEVDTGKRRKRIDASKGLAGPGKALSRVILCTIQKLGCLADEYTNTNHATGGKPLWNGIRQRMIIKFPGDEGMALWNEYVAIRIKDPKAAIEHYNANREAMDEGVEVSNPHRAVPEAGELSTIQHYFNELADNGERFCLAEYQNDPEEEEELSGETMIEPGWFSSKTGDFQRQQAPVGCEFITYGVDVGKYQLHWCCIGWLRNATGRVLDYGVTAVGNVVEDDNQAAIEFLVREAVSALYQDIILPTEYVDLEGEVHQFSRCYIDAGYATQEIYRAIRSFGDPRVLPCMGSNDLRTPSSMRRLHSKVETTNERRPGYEQVAALQDTKRPKGKIWLAMLNTNYWKQFLRDRFATGDGQVGSLRLFQNDVHMLGDHKVVGKHLAEQYYDSMNRKWVTKKKKMPKDHLADAFYYACAAAGAAGIRLEKPGEESPAARPVVRRKVPLNERMGRNKRR